MFDRCDKAEGYWTFLGEMHPIIEYDTGEVPMFFKRPPNSFLFTCLLSCIKRPARGSYYELKDLPEYDEFIETTYYWLPVGSDEDEVDIVPENRIPSEYIEAHGEPEVAGRHFEAKLSTVLEDSEYYNTFIKLLDDDKFIYKIQYNLARKRLEDLNAKQKSSDASLLDLL